MSVESPFVFILIRFGFFCFGVLLVSLRRSPRNYAFLVEVPFTSSQL